MIQFKRGSTKSWLKQKTPLAAGQPGYDKDENKLKIGDGEHLWDDLPYVVGLSPSDILTSEDYAKTIATPDSKTKPIITYGEEPPDKNTVGQFYLQYSDDEPERDYIIDWGRTGMWVYRKWKSGLAECWGTLKLTTSIQAMLGSSGNIYSDDYNMIGINYPIAFIEPPVESVSLQSPSGIVWVASKSLNSNKRSACYNLLSADKLNSATYRLVFNVRGFWK